MDFQTLYSAMQASPRAGTTFPYRFTSRLRKGSPQPLLFAIPRPLNSSGSPICRWKQANSVFLRHAEHQWASQMLLPVERTHPPTFQTRTSMTRCTNEGFRRSKHCIEMNICHQSVAGGLFSVSIGTFEVKKKALPVWAMKTRVVAQRRSPPLPFYPFFLAV